MSNIGCNPILTHCNLGLKIPKFKRYFESENLQFKAYSSFDKKALRERLELYEELAKRIWNVKR